jgi:hypothetical protein
MHRKLNQHHFLHGTKIKITVNKTFRCNQQKHVDPGSEMFKNISLLEGKQKILSISSKYVIIMGI